MGVILCLDSEFADTGLHVLKIASLTQGRRDLWQNQWHAQEAAILEDWRMDLADRWNTEASHAQANHGQRADDEDKQVNRKVLPADLFEAL